MQNKQPPTIEFETYYDQLRLKCLMDLVELAKLDKEWNPEGMVNQFKEFEN